MSARAEPLFFGPDERPLFGWLHRAEAPAGAGLVVCAPFGYEAICAHRTLRHIAEAAAAAGVPALRFDYDGCGDSAGGDRDPRRLEAWVESAGRAADFLREATGVGRVLFLGVRLGASIAALAAVERKDVAGLVAVAPVVSGRALLRELRALRMARGLPPGEDAREAAGFLLTEETRVALGAVDLGRCERAPAPEVLLIDRYDLPSGNRWADRLEELGVSIDRKRMTGYVEMMLDPHEAVVPEAMVRDAAAWLRERADGGGAEARSAGTREVRLVESGAPIAERAEMLDERVFGIASMPAEAAPARRRGLLLLNAGSVHHVGPNRLHVALARRWAAHGHVVLRLDVSGIGDSAPWPGEPENDPYTPRAIADVAAAVAWLRARAGVEEVHAIGLCSGAYSAQRAADAGVALDGFVAINPLTFAYEPGMRIAYPDHVVASEAARYRERARSTEAWKKLLAGRVRVGVLAQVMVRRAASVAFRSARGLAVRAGVAASGALGMELERIAARGVAIRFLFSAGDPGIELLREQAGPVVERLRRTGRLEIVEIAGADHTFTPLRVQEDFVLALSRFFEGPVG